MILSRQIFAQKDKPLKPPLEEPWPSSEPEVPGIPAGPEEPYMPNNPEIPPVTEPIIDPVPPPLEVPDQSEPI